MPQTVELPDNQTAEFPDEMPAEKIAEVVRKQFPPSQPESNILQEEIRAPRAADVPFQVAGAAGRLSDLLFEPGEKAQHPIISPEVAEFGTRLAATPARMASSLLEKFTGKPYSEAERGIEKGIAGAAAGFSLENLASLPSFAAPGVVEAYAAGLVAKLPEQYGRLKDSIQRYGLISPETGQAFVESGIQDVVGFLGLKARPKLTEILKPVIGERPTESITPATDQALAATERTVTERATQEREIQSGIQPERAGDVTSRPPESPGAGGGLRPAAQGQETLVQPTARAEGAAAVSEPVSPPAAAQQPIPQIPDDATVNVKFKTPEGREVATEMNAREAEGIFTKERSSYQALLDCLGA